MAESRKRSSDAMDDGTTTDPNNQIIDIPNNLEARVAFINKERMTISRLYQLSRKLGGVPDPNTVQAREVKSWLPQLELLMQWLETNLEISPYKDRPSATAHVR
jgi:hypothetical protein